MTKISEVIGIFISTLWYIDGLKWGLSALKPRKGRQLNDDPASVHKGTEWTCFQPSGFVFLGRGSDEKEIWRSGKEGRICQEESG